MTQDHVEEDEENLALQEEEMMALEASSAYRFDSSIYLGLPQAIYPQDFFYTKEENNVGARTAAEQPLDKQRYVGSLSVSIPLPYDTLQVTFEERDTDISVGSRPSENKTLTLHYLPPVVIRFVLPFGYPLRSAPLCTIECVWMSADQRRRLCEELQTVWERESDTVVLFEFAEHVRSFDVGEHLTLKNEFCGGTTLKSIMEQHNKAQTRIAFQHTTFTCGICMEEIKGQACVELSQCRHVFCLPCLSGYFSMLIREGLCSQVKCPDLDCGPTGRNGKSVHTFSQDNTLESVPSQEELILIVGRDLAERYARLSLKQKLESDPTITFCPRIECQAAVKKDPQYEKLGVCTSCGFAFCLYCQKVWHGAAVFCQLKNSNKVVDEYLKAQDANDDAKMHQLEVRYGRKNMLKLVDDYQTEMATENWKKQFTVPCPSCGCFVEKSFGCNHMTCQVCQTHFCYLCGQYIDATNPYRHFNSASSPCHMKLFQGIADHDDRWEEEIFIGFEWGDI